MSKLEFLSLKIKRIFSNSAITAFIGAIIGGLLTMYIQKQSFNIQKEQYYLDYKLERNNGLKMELNNYIDNLFNSLVYANNDSISLQNYLKGFISSYKISLWYNNDIGKSCEKLNNSLFEKMNEKDNEDMAKFSMEFNSWDSLLRKEMNLLDTNIKDFVDLSLLKKNKK